MIDIAARMHELVEILHAGINGIECPDVVVAGEWSPDYALLEELDPDTYDESEYFDRDRFREDFVKLVKGHFADDPTVVIALGGYAYLEAHREV